MLNVVSLFENKRYLTFDDDEQLYEYIFLKKIDVCKHCHVSSFSINDIKFNTYNCDSHHKTVSFINGIVFLYIIRRDFL